MSNHSKQLFILPADLFTQSRDSSTEYRLCSLFLPPSIFTIIMKVTDEGGGKKRQRDGTQLRDCNRKCQANTKRKSRERKYSFSVKGYALAKLEIK